MQLHESSRDQQAFSYGSRRYVRAPNPIHFPSEESPEERVSETKRHLETRTTLYLLLKEAFTGAFIGCEQFVYWDAGDPRKCLSPDVFVKLAPAPPSVKEQLFDTWKAWLRGAPDLAVEVISASDHRDADWEAKLARYQASGIAEVVRFDAEDEEQPLRVWDRVEGDLIEREPWSDSLWECATLGLFWVVVPTEIGPMLRLSRDREGRELLPTPSEERLRLEKELAHERKARSLAEHERSLAEHAQAEAEQKLRDAEQKFREETERLKAEIARLRGER